jgi:hypothetical protein
MRFRGAGSLAAWPGRRCRRHRRKPADDRGSGAPLRRAWPVPGRKRPAPRGRAAAPRLVSPTGYKGQGLPSVGQGKSSGGSGSYSSRCSNRRPVPPVGSPGHAASTSSVTGSKHRTRRRCPSAWTYRVSLTFCIAMVPDPNSAEPASRRPLRFIDPTGDSGYSAESYSQQLTQHGGLHGRRRHSRRYSLGGRPC